MGFFVCVSIFLVIQLSTGLINKEKGYISKTKKNKKKTDRKNVVSHYTQCDQTEYIYKTEQTKISQSCIGTFI